MPLERELFQLEQIDAPPEKLNFDEYREAKWRIFKNQTVEDYSFINAADKECVKKSTALQPRKIYFNGSQSENPNHAVEKCR